MPMSAFDIFTGVLRFLREARAAAVSHPNIAVVHEVDQIDSVAIYLEVGPFL